MLCCGDSLKVLGHEGNQVHWSFVLWFHSRSFTIHITVHINNFYLPTVTQRRSVKRKNRVNSRCQSSVTESWQLIYYARGPRFESWKHHLFLLFFAVSKVSRQNWFRLSPLSDTITISLWTIMELHLSNSSCSDPWQSIICAQKLTMYAVIFFVIYCNVLSLLLPWDIDGVSVIN